MLWDLPKHVLFWHSWGLPKLVDQKMFFLNHEPKLLPKLASPIREKNCQNIAYWYKTYIWWNPKKVLVSTFVEGTGWLIWCIRVWLGAKNNEFLLQGKSGCINLKPKVAHRFPFVKTPTNWVSSAKGVHLVKILLRVTKSEKRTRCVQGIARYQM